MLRIKDNPLIKNNNDQNDNIMILDSEVYDFWKSEEDDLYDDLIE
ncbi:hypothetical protein [Bacillus pseudomycoides]|nr:hypothetical protein [Bacillus pseudomycoides]